MNRHVQGEARYTGQGVDVRFVSRMERDHYGVPGSPAWWTPMDPAVDGRRDGVGR